MVCPGGTVMRDVIVGDAHHPDDVDKKAQDGEDPELTEPRDA